MPLRSTSRWRFSRMKACTSRMRRCRCGLGCSADGPSIQGPPSRPLTSAYARGAALACGSLPTAQARRAWSDHVLRPNRAIVLLRGQVSELDGDLAQGPARVVGLLRDLRRGVVAD